MITIFFIPLSFIALYEATLDTHKHTWMNKWLRGDDEGGEDYPKIRDPEVADNEADGLKISKVPFEELIKVFPNTQQVSVSDLWQVSLLRPCMQSSEASIIHEIQDLKRQLALVLQKLDG